MSNLTQNLGMFVYDPEEDGKRKFNIKSALTDNFNILDEKYGELTQTGNKYKYCVTDCYLNENGKADIIDAEVSSDTTYKFAQAGTYTVTITQSGTYPIAIIGGGGQGAQCADGTGFIRVGSGGAGGGFVGTITLDPDTYTVVVGSNKHASTLTDSHGTILLSAGAGGDATATVLSATAGAGGTLTVFSSAVVSANTVGSNSSHTNGTGYSGSTSYVITGQKISGASSIYGGFGAGGHSAWGLGKSGFFQMIVSSQGSTEVNYNVDEATPLVIVDAQGVRSTLFGVNNDIVDNLADGTYNKFVDDTGADFLNNEIFYQELEPASPSANDVWVKTSEDIKVYKYDSVEGEWQEYNRVWLGSVTISSGAVSGVNNTGLYYNGFDTVQSGYNKNLMAGFALPSDTYKTLTWQTGSTSYVAPANGWVVAAITSYDETGTASLYLSTTSGISDECVIYHASSSSSMHSCYVPVSHGQTFTVSTYGGSGMKFKDRSLKFIYAVGSVSEAESGV